MTNISDEERRLAVYAFDGLGLIDFEIDVKENGWYVNGKRLRIEKPTINMAHSSHGPCVIEYRGKS